MTHNPQGELRPPATAPPRPPAPLPPVRYRREPIPPEACRLGPRCLVCLWRRAGLIPPARGHGRARPTG